MAQAAQVSGMPIPDRIWLGRQPPATSYLSCMAVKCAALQSASLEEAYLRLLREALMLEAKNIALQSIILQTAEALARQRPDFDTEQFGLDLLQNGRAKKPSGRICRKCRRMASAAFLPCCSGKKAGPR